MNVKSNTMEAREFLNTIDCFAVIIKYNQIFINENIEEISCLEQDEKNGINRYPNSNLKIITGKRDIISSYYLEMIFSMYSAGYSIPDIKEIYPQLLEHVYRSSLSKKEMDFSYHGSEPFYGTDEYWAILQVLALGILLDADEDSRSKILYIRDKVPTPDIVLDMLSSYYDGREVSTNQLRGNKYNGLVNFILNRFSGDIPQRMSAYLKKQWMKDYKRQGFLTTHDSNLHVGYWSFESGAIMKIMGADDSILKDQQFYPYDMVHGQ